RPPERVPPSGLISCNHLNSLIFTPVTTLIGQLARRLPMSPVRKMGHPRRLSVFPPAPPPTGVNLMKSSFNRLWLSVMGVGALALSACSGPPTVPEVQADVPDRTVALLLAANVSANKASGGETANILLPPGDGSDTSAAALIVDD